MGGEKPVPKEVDTFPSAFKGNMWGWRFSFLGLALILLMLGIMLVRYVTMYDNLPSLRPESDTISSDTTPINH